MKIEGRCHCGNLTYVAKVDPEKVRSATAPIARPCPAPPSASWCRREPGTFKLVSGEPKTYVKTADSGNRRVQAFCPNCGTSLYAHALAGDPHIRPPIVGLRVGAIVQRDQLPPKTQYWTRSRQHWVTEIAALAEVEKE